MSNESSLEESYDVAAINDALNELGMLSSITQSRKEYLQENESLLSRLQLLSMNGEKPGPSQVSEGFTFTTDKSNRDCDIVTSLDHKEKENKDVDGLRILTMNSQFITNFKTGYSFPLNDLSPATVFRYITRKKKFRSHPYEKKTWCKVLKQAVKRNHDTLSELDQTAYRLRTTSLSSGTSSSRKVAFEKCKAVEKNVGGLQRSRSMENLTGSKESLIPTACDKSKDIDTVSKGIQEMRVEDCT